MHLRDRLVEVVQLHAGEAEEAVGRFLAVVPRPVVVGAEGRLEDFLVLDLVGVEDDAWVDHLRVDAVQLLVCDARLDVVDTGPRQLVAHLPHLRRVRPAEVEAGLQEARDHEAVVTAAEVELRPDAFAVDDVGRLIAEALDQGSEQLRGLNDVRVRRDAELPCSCHRYPPLTPQCIEAWLPRLDEP